MKNQYINRNVSRYFYWGVLSFGVIATGFSIYSEDYSGISSSLVSILFGGLGLIINKPRIKPEKEKKLENKIEEHQS